MKLYFFHKVIRLTHEQLMQKSYCIPFAWSTIGSNSSGLKSRRENQPIIDLVSTESLIRIRM